MSIDSAKPYTDVRLVLFIKMKMLHLFLLHFIDVDKVDTHCKVDRHNTVVQQLFFSEQTDKTIMIHCSVSHLINKRLFCSTGQLQSHIQVKCGMILSVGKYLKWWAQSRIYILEICITSVHKNSLNLSYLYLLELYVTCYDMCT